MKQLPEDINDAVGLLLMLKPGADKNSIDVFGQATKYYFDMKVKDHPKLTDNDRIRLHPVDKDDMIIMYKVHLLATIMGYESIRNTFQVVGTGFDTKGTIQSL